MMNLDYFYIPPLPESLMHCISYMYKDNFDIEGLIKIITKDVGITEKILSVANSQYYSKGAIPTNNLKQAVIRIGNVNILELLSAEFYKNSFKSVEFDFFTLRDFNRHSTYVSKLAVAFGELLHVENTNDLMIAGLFHDVGLMARSYCQNKAMKGIIEKCNKDKIDFYSAEKQGELATHEDLGKKVAVKWNLSERISSLIEHHHTLQAHRSHTLDISIHKELDIISLADTIAHGVECGFKNYHRDTAVSRPFLERLGLSVEAVSRKTKETFQEISSILI